MKVPIQNIFYLFCYAWNRFPSGSSIDVEGVDSPELSDLLATVLIQGTNHLIRRGLDRGYLETAEDSRTLRGRIDLSTTVKRGLLLKGEACCNFDELSLDVLHNRILRTTLRTLAATDPLDSELRHQLRLLDRRLSGVQLCSLNRSIFSRVQLHANNSFYRFLLRVCELAYDLLLPVAYTSGRYRFTEVLDDDKLMEKVFEDFVRNFYRLEQSDFSVSPGQEFLKWEASAQTKEDLRFLPFMIMDTVLRSKERRIVIDTKYYKDALRTHQSRRTLHSENLYQLLAYLENLEAVEGSIPAVEGILLYPVGDTSLDLSYTVLGKPIRIYTLNLNQPWKRIKTDLLERVLVRPWAGEQPMVTAAPH